MLHLQLDSHCLSSSFVSVVHARQSNLRHAMTLEAERGIFNVTHVTVSSERFESLRMSLQVFRNLIFSRKMAEEKIDKFLWKETFFTLSWSFWQFIFINFGWDNSRLTFPCSLSKSNSRSKFERWWWWWYIIGFGLKTSWKLIPEAAKDISVCPSLHPLAKRSFRSSWGRSRNPVKRT